MTFARRSRSFFTAALLLLTGCQSDGGGQIAYVPLLQPNSSGSDPVVGAQIEPTTLTSSRISGSLSRSNARMTISGRSGSLNTNSGTIQLDNGGTIALLFDGTEYVHRFSAQPKGQAPTFGVIGIATAVADLPKSGQSQYAGTTSVQIIDGGDLYDLSGTVRLAVNFSSRTGIFTIDDLDGTRIDAGHSVNVVNDALTIASNSIALNGAQFGSSAIQLSNSMLRTGPVGTVTSTVSGNFFGPNAAEMGGIILMSDDNSTPFALLGTFIGQ